jgi:hypothetical protein
MSPTIIRIAGILAGAAALVGALLPAAAFAEVPSDQVPASLQAAIKAEIESKGHTYAGLCRVVNEQQPLPVGQYCAFVISIEHEIAEVTYGAVASDEITRVNFDYRDGAWVKQGTTPTNPGTPGTPRPPATGDGIASDGGSGIELGLVAAAAAVAISGLALGTAAATRRR